MKVSTGKIHTIMKTKNILRLGIFLAMLYRKLRMNM